MKMRALMVLTAMISVSPMACKADPFGVASAYNIVALGYGSIAGNITDDKDITGRIAAAGTIFSNSIGVGSGLGGSDPFGADATIGGVSYSVVAGGGLSGNIQIQGNGSMYALGATGTQVDFHGSGQLYNTGSSPIDFNTLRTQLDSESTFLGTLAATGTPCKGGCPGSGVNPQWWVLTGGPGLNVFNISATDFDSHQFDIVVPAGATVLINVDGVSDNLAKSFVINGSQSGDSSNILVNFPDATTVTASEEFNASILAPFATVSGNSDFDGNIIAAAVGPTGEVHNREFDGTLPPDTPVPEPGTLALVGTGILSVAGMVRRKASLK